MSNNEGCQRRKTKLAKMTSSNTRPASDSTRKSPEESNTRRKVTKGVKNYFFARERKKALKKVNNERHMFFPPFFESKGKPFTSIRTRDEKPTTTFGGINYGH